MCCFIFEFGMGLGGFNVLWSLSNLVGMLWLGAIFWICDRGLQCSQIFGFLLISPSTFFVVRADCLGVIWSSLTGNQYGLAQRLTVLTHPTYQRRSLRRPFRELKVLVRFHLEVSFLFRCFQRLSFPNIAIRQCHWRDNRNTRGSSNPVLSY